VDLTDNEPGRSALAQAKMIERGQPVRATLARIFRQPTPEHRLRAAAEAELRTSIVLDRLGPAWRVLHSVPVGADHPEISHLAIGPSGVFTLLARRHPAWRRQLNPERVHVRVAGDEILVDGIPMPYIPQARAQAWRAARIVSAELGQPVHVRPVVVIVGPQDIHFHGPPGRVEVISRRHLARRLAEFPTINSPERVNLLYTTARATAAWPGEFAPENAPEDDVAGPGQPGPATSGGTWITPAGCSGESALRDE
jgi:hypothetical protein